ncbi:MAG: hypothetical protein M0D55_18455 [Elusimicrobiota bacterium]|nr:MAG: hypothetical protein M0D55_18455 [Elusimicrobiota bacterium]
MTRKFAAILAVLALATCAGRVSAWASAPGDEHACCRGEPSAPAEAAVIECCAVPAAVAAVRVPAPDVVLVGMPAAPPVVPVFAQSSVESEAPPGPGPCAPPFPLALRLCRPDVSRASSGRSQN